jgi:hypothetical protein
MYFNVWIGSHQNSLSLIGKFIPTVLFMEWQGNKTEDYIWWEESWPRFVLESKSDISIMGGHDQHGSADEIVAGSIGAIRQWCLIYHIQFSWNQLDNHLLHNIWNDFINRFKFFNHIEGWNWFISQFARKKLCYSVSPLSSQKHDFSGFVILLWEMWLKLKGKPLFQLKKIFVKILSQRNRPRTINLSVNTLIFFWELTMVGENWYEVNHVLWIIFW